MNYFAHAIQHLDRPYFIAGTALPDWLHVVDRRARLRLPHVTPSLDHPDERVRELALGVQQHLEDDAWFHVHPLFIQLSLQLTGQLQERLGNDRTYRPAFLGHILVELLLDAALIEEAPDKVRIYYLQLEQLDMELVTQSVYQMTGKQLDGLAAWRSRFCQEKFLYDYLDDARLVYRINQVLRRVGLTPVDERLEEVVAQFRVLVRTRSWELLAARDGRHEMDCHPRAPRALGER